MEPQVRVAIRLPENLIKSVRRVTKVDRSSLSQFVRTAIVEKLTRETKAA